MATIRIKNATVINPADKSCEKLDIFIDGDRIRQVAAEVPRGDLDIDASGCFVMPGFIDMHVHLRDPGQEYKETIETGAMAAAHGGFTTIVAMPNTSPIVDTPEVYQYVKNKADKVGINVIQVGSVTRKMEGKELSDLEGLSNAGCIAISEDGKSVMNSGIYRKAMKFAAKHNMIVLAHCEDINLLEGGVLNADSNSKKMGLPGITNAVEDVIVARDILIAKETGVHLHLCHCSTKDSVTMVKEAKKAGISVSAEVCPHHFCLTSEDIPGDDANYKMNPPLRTKADKEALIEGLHMDIMDVIATDHAPHSDEEKARSIMDSPFGIVGLETAAALTYTHLVKAGHLTIRQMAEKMSYNPARILGLDKGRIENGAIADLVIFDPEAEYEIDSDTFLSKSRNTPFVGHRVNGAVRMTIASGNVVYKAE